MYRHERVIVEDIASDPLWAGVSHLALEIGLRACWSTPLFDGAGEVIGSFAVYYRTPRRPTSDELQLGDQVGYLASLAIQIQRQEAALRESEERFRQMDEAIDRSEERRVGKECRGRGAPRDGRRSEVQSRM